MHPWKILSPAPVLSSLLFFTSFTATSLQAAVRLPHILSDHALLKSSATTRIWGWADAGEAVSVALAGKTAQTVAAADGKWKVSLDLKNSGPGPFELTVKGTNEIKVTDVLLGETWLASGQSNMEFGLRYATHSDLELARPVNPEIRFFKLERASGPEPVDDIPGKWLLAGPTTIGDVSAVAYYFARNLETALHQPIGIVQNAWGGSSVESWTSAETLSALPEFAPSCERDWTLARNAKPLREKFLADFSAWLKTTHREDQPTPDLALYTTKPIEAKDWMTVNLPAPGLPSGAIWLRRTVQITDVLRGKPVLLRCGPIPGIISIYWNGKPVQEHTLADYSGLPEGLWFTISETLVHPGANELAIRIYSPTGPVAFTGDRFTISGQVSDRNWFARAELAFDDSAALPPLPIAPPKVPNVRDTASFLYNGMLHPLLNFQFSGVIWYQGETNTGRAWQYRTAFSELIKDWRAHFAQGDLPFYFCQLPQFERKYASPQESNWAELRESQSEALKLPNTGQAVIIDTGEADDIHPHEKAPAGDRLSYLALAQVYQQKDTIPSGPVYASQTTESASVRIHFTEIANGLRAKPVPATYDLSQNLQQSAPVIRNSPNSELEGFQICGADQQWKWADAKIDGSDVLVSSPSVATPTEVRYAWSSNPTGNLTNSADLPAGPFRTDHFPAATLGKNY